MLRSTRYDDLGDVMSKALLALVLSISLLSATTASAQRWTDFGALSAKLDQNLTEQQVVAAVGRQPASVSVTTCGGGHGAAWDCKVYYYGPGRGGSSLTVYFSRRGDGVWVVNNWDSNGPS